MKKRIFAVLMGLIMVLGMVACGNDGSEGETEPEVIEETESVKTEEIPKSTETEQSEENAENREATESSAEQISSAEGTVEENEALIMLSAIWDAYAEEDRFDVFGGNPMENQTQGAPAEFELNEDWASFFCANTLIPVDMIPFIEDNATLYAFFNAEFNAVAIKVVDMANAKGVLDAIREEILECDYYYPAKPELLKMAYSDNCIVYTYGKSDLVNKFEKYMLETYPDMKVEYSEEMGQEVNNPTESTGQGFQTNSKGEIIDDGF